MKLYKFLLTLILLFLTTKTLKAQTFLYTYTDPCTGLLKSLTVPSNGVTVTYFNQIQTFSPQDFQNGVFDTWATGVLNSYGNANPCGSVLGVSTSVDVAQGSAMSFISIINNLTAVSELQSAMGGGSLNTMSVIESAKSSSGGKKDKKDKDNNNSNQSTTTTTTTNQSSNQSGVSSESSQNSQTNSESQNVQSSQSGTNNQTTSNQSGQSSQNGEAGQNSTSSSNQTETGVTQNGSQTSSETGQINSTGQVGQTTSQASGNGSNQESGEQNQTTSNQTGGESGQTSSTESQNNSTNSTQTTETTNNTTGENGSNSSENGTENQTNTENSTSSTNSSASNGSGTGSNAGANENPPDNSQNTTETTEDKKTNVLGGTVNSSQRSTEGNKPQIVLSSDFAGFNFKDKEVTFGGKGTAGWTSLSWDGRKSYGVLLDYTSVIKGPNITGFYANMAKRRIDLISVTGTISFYGRGSQYGTLAVGQMWSFPKVKNLKAIYLATGSFGNVYGEKFLGTAMIAGGMYDWKVSKRIDIKMMNLFIYAPYVSYYNDILLKSPYVIMPIIGTNIGITKKFKFNVNFGGAYAITQNVMNFTLMFGTRFAL